MATHRWGRAGAECPAIGTSATDLADGQSLVCRGGVYVRTASLLSNFSLVGTRALQFVSSPIQVPKPQCDSYAGVGSEPLIIMVPNNEDPAMQGTSTITGVNRFAVDRGDAWELFVERSSDRTILPGNVVALIYCFYQNS
jgi:hypothetical protein